MTLSEIFSDGEEVKKARRNKEWFEKKLKKKGTLDTNDQYAYETVLKIIKRQRTKMRFITGGSILSAGLTAFFIYQMTKKPLEKSPSQFSTDNRDYESSIPLPDGSNWDDLEKRTQKLMEKAEGGFQKFEQHIMPLILNLEDESLSTFLKQPFELFHLNNDNPFKKNRITLKKYAKAQGSATVQVKNRGYYYYKLMPPQPIDLLADGSGFSLTKAAFNKSDRSLLLSENFDENNILDMLSMYHELIHGVQDFYYQARLPLERRKEYEELFTYGTKGIVIVREETEAFAGEIELANLLLDNQLRLARVNNQKLDADEILDKFNIVPNVLNTAIVEDLIDYSQHYYPEGMKTNGEFNQEFSEAVKNTYSSKGVIIYDIIPF